MEIQKRFSSEPVKVRQDEGSEGPGTLVGTGAVVYDGTERTEFLLDDFAFGDTVRIVERIMPGAFNGTIKKDDTRSFFNHDPNQILGRKSAKTMRSSVAENGDLTYEVDLPNNSTGQNVAESVGRGDVDGSSIMFVTEDEKFRKEPVDVEGSSKQMFQGIVEIKKVKLYEQGPVTFPAYTATTAGMRSSDPGETVKRFKDWDKKEGNNPALLPEGMKTEGITIREEEVPFETGATAGHTHKGLASNDGIGETDTANGHNHRVEAWVVIENEGHTHALTNPQRSGKDAEIERAFEAAELDTEHEHDQAQIDLAEIE